MVAPAVPTVRPTFKPRAILLLLSLMLALIVAPVPAFAEGTDPLGSANAWKHDYVTYGSSSRPRSFITSDASGNLQRVEYCDGSLVVETYSSDYKLTGQKTIDPSTYAPSTLASGNSVLWGGFFGGSSANYVVTGQYNLSEDDTLPVVRVTKYSKGWEYLANCEYRGINTYIPFDAGSCDLCEVGGTLYIKTCHEMYQSSDGLHHQAAMAFQIDEDSMVSAEALTTVTFSEFGYVSHSFNQYLATLGGEVYAVDQGDSYPRSVVLHHVAKANQYSDGSTLLSISGESSNNVTHTTVGGVATSAMSNTILTVGTQRDQSKAYSGTATDYPRNVWLTVTNAADLTSTKKIDLTSYAEGSETDATNPYIVQVGDDEFLILWAETQKVSGYRSLAYRNTIDYVFADGQGNITKALQTFTGRLSDCRPVVRDGQVV